MSKVINMPKTTSITVSQLTLKWINAIKGLYEYTTGGKQTLDQTILMLCVLTDYHYQRDIGNEKQSIQDFANNRIKDLLENISDKYCKYLTDNLQLNNEKLNFPFWDRCPGCGKQLSFERECLNPLCKFSINYNGK